QAEREREQPEDQGEEARRVQPRVRLPVRVEVQPRKSPWLGGSYGACHDGLPGGLHRQGFTQTVPAFPHPEQGHPARLLSASGGPDKIASLAIRPARSRPRRYGGRPPGWKQSRNVGGPWYSWWLRTGDKKPLINRTLLSRKGRDRVSPE